MEDTEEQEDINLLQMVCASYEELDANFQTNNYIRKVTRVFKRLVDVVYLIKNNIQIPVSLDIMNRNLNNRTILQNIFGGPQDLSNFSSPQSRSPFIIPTSQPWEYIHTDGSSKSTSDVMSAASSASFTKSLEVEHYPKAFEPFQLQSVDTTSQPQCDSPGSRKRARLYKPDKFPVSSYQDSLSQFSLEQFMMDFDLPK